MFIIDSPSFRHWEFDTREMAVRIALSWNLSPSLVKESM